MESEFRQYCGTVAITILLGVLATCPMRGHGPKAKSSNRREVGPPPQDRTLTLPNAYAAKASVSRHAHHGSAASKVVASSAPWTVVRESTHQTPIFMESNQPQPAAKRANAVAPETEVLQFITENAALFRLRDPATELVHRATTRDRTGREHVQLEQRYQDVPVWGAAIVGHWSSGQGLYAVNGRYQPSPDYITEVEPAT